MHIEIMLTQDATSHTRIGNKHESNAKNERMNAKQQVNTLGPNQIASLQFRTEALLHFHIGNLISKLVQRHAVYDSVIEFLQQVIPF